MSISEAIKPVFDGYMKIYLHDDTAEQAVTRTQFTAIKYNNML